MAERHDSPVEVLSGIWCRTGPPIQAIGRDRLNTTCEARSTSTTSSPRDHSAALLAAAFEHLGLRRVTAAANLDNHASVRVLEKAGMRRERHEVQALWHHELGWLDEVGYALLAEEWTAAPVP